MKDTNKKWINKIHEGHVLDILKKMPSGLVDCVITSPPYWQMRDYGVDLQVWDGDVDCDHFFDLEEKIYKRSVSEKSTLNAGKGINDSSKIKKLDFKTSSGFCKKCGAWKGSLGLEPSFTLFIKHLCDIFDEVRRVLKDSGTCWVNIGDTYNGSGGAGSQYSKWRTLDRHTQFGKKMNLSSQSLPTNEKGYPKKSLCMVPQRFAIEMINRGWILRNVIIWEKPNCIPESVSDRFTVNFEYVYFFTKSTKYWFEQQFEPYQDNGSGWDRWCKKHNLGIGGKKYVNSKNQQSSSYIAKDQFGRNKRSIWRVNTRPFSGLHFAVFNEDLIKIPIKAGCPEYICKKCSKAKKILIKRDGESSIDNMKNKQKKKIIEKCNCNAGWRPGIVLDPFIGSGTTALVALKQGKNFIGIELNPEYVKMARKRIESYLKQKKLLDIIYE